MPSDIQTLHAFAALPDEQWNEAWLNATPQQRAYLVVEAERLRRALEDPTPGHLAKRLDPLTIQTPALGILDAKMVQIRDAIGVMYERRARLAELIDAGMDEQMASEQASVDVPSAGIDRLIVSMPPQEGKSERISRYGVIWLLRQFPTLRIGIVSYDGANAGQFSYKIRADIELFNGTSGNVDLGLRLAKDQKAMGRWMLDSGGGVYAIGIGGGLTGRPLDLLLIDDPVKDYRAAESLLQSEQAWEWWQTVARPRLAPWAPVVEVATRWHEADLGGRMRAKQKADEEAGAAHYDRWTVVNIPAKADHDPAKAEVDILGRQPGEYMVSARGRTRAQWEATEIGTAPRFWFALYQGRPTPDVGDILLREWWRRYDAPIWSRGPDGTFLLDGYDVSQSWDFAFKETDSTDFVVGQVWAKKSADSFLVYQLRRRLSFTATIDQVRRVTALFPQARRKIIEDKANGPAVIDSLQHEIPGIIPANPTTSKTARAIAISPFIRAGNIHLPTEHVAMYEQDIAWSPDGLVEEATAFPNGTHDDQVDALTQYVQEAYLDDGGPFTITSPTGDIPRTRVPARGAMNLSAVQRRLTEQALGGRA